MNATGLYNFSKKILIILAAVLLISGCQSVSSPSEKQEAEQPGKNMEKENSKKILMVVAPLDFKDEEFNQPHEIFQDNGYKVDVASIQKGKALGVKGTEVKIDLMVGQIPVEDYEAVMFVGGPGMAEIVGDDSLQILARKFHKNDKLTTAICVAPAILAKAGILEGKKATSFSNAKDALVKNNADFTGDTVTVDGKIVTGNGPEAASEFAQTVVDQLK